MVTAGEGNVPGPACPLGTATDLGLPRAKGSQLKRGPDSHARGLQTTLRSCQMKGVLAQTKKYREVSLEKWTQEELDNNCKHVKQGRRCPEGSMTGRKNTGCGVRHTRTPSRYTS